MATHPNESIPLFAVRITRLEQRLWPSAAVVSVLGIWGGVVGLLMLILSLTESGMSACLFKNATRGVPCLTCGATRLSLYTASGRFMSAMLQNPFVFTVFALFFVWLVSAFVFRRRIRVVMKKPIRRIVIWTIILLAIINWAYVVAIDGPWDTDLKAVVADKQMQDHGLSYFFAHDAPSPDAD